MCSPTIGAPEALPIGFELGAFTGWAHMDIALSVGTKLCRGGFLDVQSQARDVRQGTFEEVNWWDVRSARLRILPKRARRF